jgi:hypothetical protein
MNKSNTKAWNTKYGRRRVRSEAPTLAEAIVAAQGLSDDVVAQAKIAASLIGMPVEQVQAELLKTPPLPKEAQQTVTFAGPATAPRLVVVERKLTRRVATAGTGAERTERPAFRGPISLPPRRQSASRPS